MKRLLLLALIAQACSSPGQPTGKATYMQIFYDGPSWLSGQPLIHYSPAFRGKAGETVTEPDSIRRVSPGAGFLGPDESITQTGTTETTTTVHSSEPNDKPSLQELARQQQESKQEAARFKRGLNLMEARAALGRDALVKALNEAAADGWEVVQMVPSGGPGTLVYLLRRR